MMWLSLLNALRRVPGIVYAWVAGGAMLAALVAWHAHGVNRAYARGRADVEASAHFDSTLVRMAFARHDTAAAHTDTVVRVVQRIARRVDSVVVRVPDSVRVAYPVVDTLVVESKALVAATDSLTRTLTAERASTTALLATMTNNIHAARLAQLRAEDQMAALSHRPRWSRVLLTDVVLVGVTYLVASR